MGRDGKRYPASRPESPEVEGDDPDETPLEPLLPLTVIPAANDREAKRAGRIAQGPDLPPGVVSLRDAERTARTQAKRDRVGLIDRTSLEPVDGRFPVIVADPPWRYEQVSTPDLRAVENHYPTMTSEQLADLTVPAAEDAVLFLWATSPKLPEALALMVAWDFAYRTCMVWVKDRIGMGYYARQQHELVLIGRRGSLATPDPSDRPSSVLTAPRGEHSAKPASFYELVATMYPGLARLEMFARQPRDGWAVWGNQASGEVAG